MKKAVSLSLLTLVLALLAPVAHAQSWVTVVPSESEATTVSLPAGAIIRWCDAATGKTCSPPETFAAATQLIAYCPRVAACSADDGSDGLSGTNKLIQVQQMFAVQIVTVDGVGIPIPALPVLLWPSVSFTPGTSYWTLVGNLPPTPSGALQGSLKIYSGNTLIASFVCTMGTTMVVTTPDGVTPQSLAAPFGCVAQPVTTQ